MELSAARTIFARLTEFETAGHQLAKGVKCRFCGCIFVGHDFPDCEAQYPLCTFAGERFFAEYGAGLRQPKVFIPMGDEFPGCNLVLQIPAWRPVELAPYMPKVKTEVWGEHPLEPETSEYIAEYHPEFVPFDATKVEETAKVIEQVAEIEQSLNETDKVIEELLRPDPEIGELIKSMGFVEDVGSERDESVAE